ncbi:LytTR family DNA-binding domain-containing protein [uncultured Alteromonas sp.]|jgi:two-component system LytT family response regulator|uniref:LytR/AlgR family response regulator transcription factor n=1 Tax=uncultured Alteromonas sp. TaxID=179113 RepID=UPI0025E6071E|nr:LytTR family DNA-binding domain-containing protein [uncultured Alteromonas sp.]
MRVVIVEDSRLARLELCEQLSQLPDVTLVGQADTVESARGMINELQPDLILLDIDLPGGNGFDLLEQLEVLPLVVFTTAYDEFAVRSFEVDALDYLLKPITLPRLTKALTKAQGQLRAEPTGQTDATLHANSQLFVKEGEQCWLIKLHQVQLFESVGNYTRVYFDQHKPMLNKAISHIEARLPEAEFFRINRSEIINLAFIDEIEVPLNGQWQVRMQNGRILVPSRRQAQAFKQRLSL